jgi:NADPH:quinone reductase-like Zn-dependent oxidoreductase
VDAGNRWALSIQFGHVWNGRNLQEPRESGLMRAAVMHAHGGPAGIRVEDVPDPEPGPGEVLIRVAAVCVNRTDVHVMEGTNIGRSVVLPHIGGLDPAGVVERLGPGAQAPPVGTRVVARPLIPCQACRFCETGRESVCERPAYVGVHRPGGFGELVVLPAGAVFPLPDGLPLEQAAATAHSVPVVLHLLDDVGRVGPEDSVLVVGAAGGLGLAAVQVARRLGARVIAAAGDPTKLEALRAVGADDTLSYADAGSLSPAVKALTGGQGVTVAVDNVGSPELWPHVVASLDKGGRILSCGAHAGGLVEIDLSLFYRMQLRLLSTAGTTREEFREALDLVATGAVAVPIHGVWPLEAIADAFRELIGRRNTGKIVVSVDPRLTPA